MPLYQILVLKNVRKRQSKITCPDFCRVQKDYATKTSLQVRIKKRKKMYESRTTLCNNSQALRQFNVIKRTCKGTEFCNGAFDTKKVKYVSQRTLALCSKN